MSFHYTMDSLHEAAARCQYKQLVILLMNGDVNAQDDRGQTPLHWATVKGQMRCFKLLLQAGAQTDIHNCSGKTPVHLVAAKGQRKAMKFFLKNGIDINIRSRDGETPLISAVLAHKSAMVQFLCQKGADLEAITPCTSTALHWAITHGESGTDIALILIKYGANIEAKDLHGYTPLHYAAMFDSKNIAEHLLQLKVKMNTKSVYECTPLQMAVLCGNGRMVGLLLEKGGDVNETDKDGKTLLHLSICSNNSNLNVMEMVEFLVNEGADPDAKDGKGLTPIFLAAFNGRTEVVQYLCELGADLVDRQNAWRCDVLVLARRGHYSTTIEYLEKLFHLQSIDQ